MATCSVARIFTNSIFSAALGNMSKFYCSRLHENSIFSAARKFALRFSAALGIVQVNLPSALACTKIREISATDQVAINIIEHVSCKFVKFVGKKSEIRGP